MREQSSSILTIQGDSGKQQIAAEQVRMHYSNVNVEVVVNVVAATTLGPSLRRPLMYQPLADERGFGFLQLRCHFLHLAHGA